MAKISILKALEHTTRAIKEYINKSTVEIDSTLTQSGYAADAKVVGDKIGNINSILDAINGEVV